MTQVVRFAAPHRVEIIETSPQPLTPGQVRVRTVATGISAGTELTAYRGTNPYLTSTWDPDQRVFQDAATATPPGYPLDGWGYSEVGEVVEVAADPARTPQDDDVAVGDVVWGIWGHRSEGVLSQDALRGHRLPDGLDPVAGCFVRVGAIALNAVLAADLNPGSTVVVLGQGVIGLLATRFATLAGARVIAVDGIANRREVARSFGADDVLSPGPELPYQVREITSSTGVDVAIELSGSYAALQSATRVVGPDGTVVASGFYQGEANGLRLGDEFHHNRVRIVASQIGGVPPRLTARWDVPRLQRTVVDLLHRGTPDVRELISHRFPITDAAAAYELLDTDGAAALQVVLDA
ncbi:zinc-binding alcohol dehydrogenase [Cellulomonas sp. PhB143]|uniref:zinc-dependent alcohol dehydrogenase n=1 Tax=Cellulomonas sp. PhB143 TaxID=2485186 RepID=UPI000F483C6D|nr:zinc-binding alcohol dehydrogenase [Cellulomonas sp. PhB143]ROS75473.1 2-desacetyl-2-hydroxyethyl bacteriochlorophyllide A dehydrogenase [Cellulomonas sp. PhB143]